MRRFWLFYGTVDLDYPSGGMADFKKSANTVAEMMDSIPRDAEWWHVFDSSTGQIVMTSPETMMGAKIKLGPVFTAEITAPAIYNVGPNQIDSGGLNRFKWVVAWYEYGNYEGNGTAISFDGTKYRIHSLSHCSCYGTEVGMEDGDIIQLDSFLGDHVTPGNEVHPLIVAKVRELTK
jgi:hypothetical protein